MRDAAGADISTTSSTTQFSANWDASTDSKSGISGNQYAIGTSAGGTQTMNWTSLGNVTTATKTGLTLNVGQTYYFSVKGVNGAGLASLDFTLPSRGLLYRFTTPRGDVEITAREASNDLLRRLVELLIVAVVSFLVWLAVKYARRGSFGWLVERTGSTMLICLGLLAFFFGVLPVVGLAAAAAGCGTMILRKTRKTS